MNAYPFERYWKWAAVIALIGMVTGTQAANQYWDSATDAGYQHGTGVWSTADANWTANGGAPLAVWAQTNRAVFASTDGSASRITVNSGTILATGLVFTGNGYTLIVTNGATVSNGTLAVSMIGGANRIEMAGGATAAYWKNPTTLNIGLTNGNNAFWVDGLGTAGSAWATNGGVMTVGNGTGSDGNRLVVTNGGYLFNGNAVYVGFPSTNNSVEVTGGGSTWNLGGQLMTVGRTAGANGNRLTIDGQGTAGGARVTNMTSLVVGLMGASENVLTIKNGGYLFSGTPYVMVGATSSYNRVTVAGGGALWNAGAQTLYIGYTMATGNVLTIDGLGVAGGAKVTNVLQMVLGSGVTGNGLNRLVITNGGNLFSASTLSYLGNYSISNSAEISGGGALWNLGGAILTIGRAGGVGNRLLIDGQGVSGGAQVTNLAAIVVGDMLGGRENELVITNGGHLVNTANLTVGYTSSYNRLTVVGPGSLCRLGANYLFVGDAGSTGNVLTIDGLGVAGGAVVTNGTLMRVGNAAGANFNRMVITNGGALYHSGMAYVGQASFSNSAEVTGGGALWNLGAQALVVGHATGGNGNRLAIDGQGVAGGARVTNVAALTVGNLASNAFNEMVITNGGQLFTTGAALIGYTSSYNRVSVAGTGSVWHLNGQTLTLGRGTTATTGNVLTVDGQGVAAGALVTNAGAITVGSLAGSVFNELTITNGGRVYSRGTSVIGSTASNNTARVIGAGSVWDHGGSNLTIGTAGYLENALVIDQGGSVLNVGTLTVLATNDLILSGGTLTATNITSGLQTEFVVGDGTQAASLGGLGGGILSFPQGLFVNSNAQLTGQGVVTGGNAGVILTNGAAIAPGLAGAGSLTIRGSNLVWRGGATYRCDITNLATGPGVGWDVLNVSSQLVMTGEGLCRISVESQGQATAGYLPGSDYNILIMTLGDMSGLDLGKISLRTNDFANPANGTWGVTNFGTSVDLAYRAAVSVAAVYTWDAPSNGNWTVGMNWTNRSAPPVNSLSMILQFGVGGSTARYTATNNNAGWFALNQLVLTNANAAATNALMGNGLEFWNTGAGLEQGGAGPMIISNAVNLRADLALSGNGSGAVTLAGAIGGTGTLTKTGSSTVILPISNNFSGVATVNGAGGVLRMDNVNALGTNSFAVNSGTLWGTVDFSLGVGSPYRTAQVAGSGAVWSNSLGLTLGTNGLITVDNGGRLACGLLTVAHAGVPNTGLIVTNGGQLFSRGATVVGTTTSNNTVLVTGTDALWNHANSNLTIGAGSYTNSQLRIDQAGSVLNVGTLTVTPSNDLVLLGGTLTASNLMSTKGSLLTVGNGVQAVALGILGGSWTNTAGILVQSNATVSGRGQLTGANGGLIITNGSTLIPGLPESATNTMGTILLGNSTWYGGMTLDLNVTNVAGTNGSGWDLVRVVGNLNLIPNGGKLKIKLDSLGETVGGFNANTARVINLVDFTTASVSTNDIEVDTNKFLIGNNWFLEVTATDIRYVYRRAESGIYVATNGNNSVGTNWVTAFTTLSNALTYVQNYDTVYVAGQTFGITSQVALSGRVGVSILGGYQAAAGGALPGANDPVTWPTVLQRTNGNTRILYLSGLTNGLIKDLTVRDGSITVTASTIAGPGIMMNQCRALTLDNLIITNNYAGHASYTSVGGGLYAAASIFTLTNCLITMNTPAGIGNSRSDGGGVYLASSVMTMSNCRVTRNRALGGSNTGLSPNGGGLYVDAGSTGMVIRSVISMNQSGNQGGGIYNLGRLNLINGLVDHNDALADNGDGLGLNGGVANLSNCTIADNGGVGILYSAGTVSITNSILWGHLDDLKNFPNDGQIPVTLSNVFYSCIGNGDNNGRQGCISIDPQFADALYYHLRSIQEHYTGGYFSGGSWTTAISNSPVIDKGDPAADYSLEPTPNGGRINLGAYGNTPVASKTDITTVFTVPAVANLGATVCGHRTARLNGQVTATGGQTPEVRFYYWITGNASTSMVSAGLRDVAVAYDVAGLTPGSAYEYYLTASNVAGVSTSLVAAFSTHGGGAALYVSTNGSNTAGTSWSTAYTNLQEAIDIIEDGDTVHLAGHTFARSPGFQQSSLWTWSGDSGVTVIGGYQATSDVGLPGANDPLQWPTVLTLASSTARIVAFANLTNCTLRRVTIRNGFFNTAAAVDGVGMHLTSSRGFILDQCVFTNNIAYGTTIRGGGLFVAASSVFMTNCLFTKNRALANGNSRGLGGGLFVNSGSITMVLCRVENNTAEHANNPGGPWPSGGGIYVDASATGVLIRTVVRGNYVSYYGTSVCGGGGIFSYGSLLLQNCLIFGNNDAGDLADGIYAAGGAMRIQNCTVAHNSGGVGIMYNAGGTIGITNSIIWGHSDDLKNFPNNAGTLSNVAYCIIKDGDNSGIDGCISLDPLFIDANYYHVHSQQGQYTNGFFSGGGWGVGLSNSPAIDQGDPASDYTNEPAPRGDAINLGAYGNTEVASMTLSVVANPAVVTNYGATVWGHRTVRLNGEVLDTGGDIPTAGFLYWEVGNSVTSMVSEGLKTAGFGSDVIGLTPASDYEFVAYASNSAGLVLSNPRTFSTHPTPSSLYVSTNGNNTAGTSWTTAYTNLQEAFDNVEAGDTIYLAGQAFSNNPGFAQTDIWTLRGKSNIVVIGGYAATNDAVLPGANDPQQWPTRLTRMSSTQARILRLSGVTNSLISKLRIMNGYWSGGNGTIYAMGIYIDNSAGLSLQDCVITNITMSSGPSYGGAMYITGSSVVMSNGVIDTVSCWNGNNGGVSYGAGIFLNSGTMTVSDTTIRNCQIGVNNGGTPYGGAIFVNSGARLNLYRSVLKSNRSNWTTGNGYGGGIYNAGTSWVENCLIFTNGTAANQYGGGIQSDGTMTILNSTIANNRFEGIRVSGGTLAVTNSIIWGNGVDLTGTMSVAYCDIGTANAFWTNGVNGCLSQNPLFVDTTYYHLQSRAGHYVGGYFSGGSWSSSIDNDSPCIDAGDPTSPYSLEPAPNGRLINLGAYGNTPVASKKLTPTGSIFTVN